MPDDPADSEQWPDWWSWDLQLSDHVAMRMPQRDFNEAELRAMLNDAWTLTPGDDPGRWIAYTRWNGAPWQVVLEPDPSEGIIVVVTAFEVDR